MRVITSRFFHSHSIQGIGISLLLLFALLTSTSAESARFVLPEDGKVLVGELQHTIVRENETLLDIARHYDVGVNEISAANPGVDPWLPEVGKEIIIPTRFMLPDGPREGIVVNLAEMRLYYFPTTPSGPQASVITHPIGIGLKQWETPIGEYQVLMKLDKTVVCPLLP